MLISFVLTYVISLTLQSPISLNIHHQYKNISLISPIYFIHGGRWDVIPNSEIDVDAVMRNHIELDSDQDIIEGALIYNIQRRHVESDKPTQNESKYIQLLVAWRVEHTKVLHVRTLLVEHDNELDWDEDKLRRLHQKHWHSLNTLVSPIETNWLLDDTTVLAMTIKVMNGDYRWDVFISEGIKNNVKRPFWINAKR
jgi:hypothetical protein